MGEISTRSRFFSLAILSASKGGMIPICLPSSSITRISRARMRSLVRINFLSMQPLRREKRSWKPALYHGHFSLLRLRRGFGALRSGVDGPTHLAMLSSFDHRVHNLIRWVLAP